MSARTLWVALGFLAALAVVQWWLLLSASCAERPVRPSVTCEVLP